MVSSASALSAALRAAMLADPRIAAIDDTKKPTPEKALTALCDALAGPIFETQQAPAGDALRSSTAPAIDERILVYDGITGLLAKQSDYSVDDLLTMIAAVAAEIPAPVSHEIVRNDLTYGPAALYHFNKSIADASGNGLDLSVDTGTVTYGLLGQRTIGVRLTGLRLVRAFNAALHQLGDMTVSMWLNFEAQPTGASSFCVFSGGSSDATEALNFNYQIAVTDTDRVPSWFSEHAVGVNDSYVLTGLNLPPPGVLFDLTVTRISNVIQFYVNGVAFGPASSAITQTTGGTSAQLYVGGLGGTGTPTLLSGVLMSELMIIARGLSAAEVKAKYNATLGPFVGLAA